MEYYRNDNFAFMRLEPGEGLVESLIAFAKSENVDFATITSGVGMIDGLHMGFFCVNNNDYDTYRIAGVYDLSSISGNITLFEGEPRPHVHIVANKPNYETVSGHLMEAKAHITMEVGLSLVTGTGFRRKTELGRPATFITRE